MSRELQPLGRAKPAPFYARPTHRALTAALGALLLGVGVYVLLVARAPGIVRLPAGAALVLLGANAVRSAYRAKASWLSRIGPLP